MQLLSEDYSKVICVGKGIVGHDIPQPSSYWYSLCCCSRTGMWNSTYNTVPITGHASLPLVETWPITTRHVTSISLQQGQYMLISVVT